MQIELILQKLTPIQEQLHHVYNEKEYINLVQALGVDEQEWQQLQKASGDFFKKGNLLLRQGQFAEAKPLLHNTFLIKPNEVAVVSAMSELYLQLWKKSTDPEDAKKAEYYSNRCLRIDPAHEASLTRLHLLHPTVSIDDSSSKSITIIIIALVIALILIGMIIFFVLQQYPPHDVGSSH